MVEISKEEAMKGLKEMLKWTKETYQKRMDWKEKAMQMDVESLQFMDDNRVNIIAVLENYEKLGIELPAELKPILKEFSSALSENLPAYTTPESRIKTVNDLIAKDREKMNKLYAIIDNFINNVE